VKRGSDYGGKTLWHRQLKNFSKLKAGKWGSSKKESQQGRKRW
jgi:hypothetical protein